MNAAARAEIERHCRDLVLAITQHGDLRELEQAAALFTPDGTWLRGDVRYTGAEEIIASYRRGSATEVARHLNGGTRVTVVDEDHAQSVTYYLAVKFDPGTEDAGLPLPLRPFSMGEWHDTFVRTADGWRFAARVTKRVFERGC